MNSDQFRTLYREFLFRMVDRDLLSVHAQGDMSKLLGRLAAILVWISLPFGGLAIGVAQGGTIAPVHSIIATTMLIVSVFCVLSWDTLLPDRRDLLVLMPLGVSAATMFTARIASLFAAMGTAVVVFNAFPGLLFPFALTPPRFNLLQIVFSVHLYRAIAAYWLTVMLAGAFIVFAVCLIQAVTSQLPRALALRLSSLLQIATFCVAVLVYFLQPSFRSVDQLAAPENQRILAWLPSYWFLGLFHQLNGSALSPRASRAWIALALAGTGAAAALAFCAGVLRRIAEQPDVVPVGHRRSWNFGWSPRAAILHWTARTLLRSRQHRVLVSFYCGVGFAAVILFLQTPRVQVMSGSTTSHDASLALIAASFVMLVSWMVGVRAAFAVPIELRANWIFRLALTAGPAEPLAATRVSLLATGVLPMLGASAVAFAWLWPLSRAAQHLLILAVIGATLAAICLRQFHKIPFACAWLPGTSHIHITMALCVLLGLNVLFGSAKFETRALSDPTLYLRTIGFLTAAAAACWWRLLADPPPKTLSFDEAPAPAVLTLGIARDGYATR